MNKLIILAILVICSINLAQSQTLKANQLHQIYTRNLVVSGLCNNNGYLYGGRCYCIEGYKGRNCTENSFIGWDENNATVCEDLTNRLDHLQNIGPQFGTFDDNLFPRLSGDSIGKGQAAYGEKGSTWVKMHDISENFQVFNRNFTIKPQDVGQGALGNCYLLAALASLANIRNGQPIVDIFETQSDNANRTYVAKFFLDGKVRYIAVDDWVPGSGRRASFSQPVNNNQFWVIILEKMWAKVHGDYMVTEGGWQTNVWKALTQAPIGQLYHSSFNATSLFLRITELLNKQWAVGTATINNVKKDLVQGHAYSVLGTYNFTNDNGQRVLLVKCYNPWHSENNYPSNPWRDNSTNWTATAKAATTYNQDNLVANNWNDGVFYLTHQDFYDQFGISNWAEIYKGYSVTFQEVPIVVATGDRVYQASFQYFGDAFAPFYISVETIDGRLLKGCTSPFQVLSLRVITPMNHTLNGAQEGWESVRTVKIEGKQIQLGNYRVEVVIRNPQPYHKFFTFSIYSQQDKIRFSPRNSNDTYNEQFSRLCPNNCSRRGVCNTLTGQCRCDFGWNTTLDCRVKTTPVCLNNCNFNGTCTDGNICLCNPGFNGIDCKPCTDLKGTNNCLYWKSLGYFDPVKFPQYKAFIEQSCQKSAQIGTCKI